MATISAIAHVNGEIVVLTDWANKAIFSPLGIWGQSVNKVANVKFVKVCHG
jgi:hypothetical protein